MGQKRQLSYFQYKVFSTSAFSGNSVGIVVNPSGLTNEEKQNIAKTLNLETTVYVNAKSDNKFDIEYFTPLKKIKFCGSALLGTALALIDQGKVINQSEDENKPESLKFYANEDKQIVKVLTPKNSQNLAFFNFLPFSIKTINIEIQEIFSCLGVSTNDVVLQKENLIINSGLNQFFVNINLLETMKNLKPKLNDLFDICKNYGIDSLVIFSKETEKKEISFHFRDFTPTVGNNEQGDSTTISAGLLYFLDHLKQLDINENSFLIKQGYNTGKTSNIKALLLKKDNKISKIQIISNGYLFLRGAITI